jgi:hypothetical protein
MPLNSMQWGTLEYIFAIFAVATAVGVLLQAGVLLGFFFAFLKIRGQLEKILSQVTEHALPLIASSKTTLEAIAPKVQAISANLAEVSEMLKQETHTVKISVDDVLEKTRAQTARVDEMVSGTLDGLSQAGAAIQEGMEAPMRHLQGIFAGVKAAFETLTRPVAPAGGAAAPVVVIVEEAVATEAPLV